MQVQIIDSKQKLGTAISSIKKRGATLDSDIHVAAVSCLHHAFKHGDVTLATRLIDAMPKSGRRKALIHWMNEHSMMSYSDKESCFRMTKSKRKSWKLEQAESTPFWEFSEEKAPAELKLEALINSVVNRIKKAKEENRLEEGFTVKGFESKLRKELATLEA